MVATPTVPDYAPCTLTCWVVRAAGSGTPSGWRLERLYVREENLTNSVYYTEPVSVKDTLSGDVVDTLAGYLPEHLGDQVITAKEIVLELPDLVLANIRVTASAVSEDIQRVIVTFRLMIGRVARLFAPGKAPPLQSNPARDVARELFDLYAEPLSAVREMDEGTDEALSQTQFELEVLEALKVEVDRQIARAKTTVHPPASERALERQPRNAS